MSATLKNNLVRLINEDWFYFNGTTEPAEAFEIWSDWLKKRSFEKRSFEQMLRKLLLLALDVSEGTIRNYFHRDLPRQKMIGRATEIQLNIILTTIAQSLGIAAIPRSQRIYSSSKAGSFRKRKQLALFTELNELPSLPYTKTLLSSFIASAISSKFDLSIYEATEATLARSVKKALHSNCPDAVIILRMDPERKSKFGTPISYFQHLAIPVLLVHAPRRIFNYPVVANFVSNFGEIAQEALSKWVQKIPLASNANNTTRHGEAVIVHVALKKDATNLTDAHRFERVHKIEAILEKAQFQTIRCQVPDYSFHHALSVYKKYPNASLYICLSDQIAVSLKQLLLAQQKPTTKRIVGFDNSSLAEIGQITSFEQNLESIAPKAIQILHDHLKQARKNFQNHLIEISLEPRD